MHRLAVIGALFAGACGATDDRPRTLSYITDTILAPTCALAECHSAFRQQVGDEFDTVEAARRSIVANGLVVYPDDVIDARHSLLITVLRDGAPSILDPGSGNVRMPYDAPMPDADVDLIQAWIADGAAGAQCTPNAQGRGCSLTAGVGGTLLYHVVECSDGNVGAVVTDCLPSQTCEFYRENGQCTDR